MNRKEFLKRLGMLTVGASLIGVDMNAMASEATAEATAAAGDVKAGSKTHPDLDFAVRPLKAATNRAITAIIIGAGSRGTTYGKYALQFPDTMKIVGVADANNFRKRRTAKAHNIPAENCFNDWADVFEREKFADAVIIATPDNLHYEPCMKALAMGYDVLLEKPAAQTEKECKDILQQAKKYNRIVAICHVLRYAPYFIAMREAVHSGLIGDLVSIQHMEPIQYAHMAHSYVRGKWRDSKQTTPIILAKSCHDLDIIRWIVDKPCIQIAAEGTLMHFKAENAPQGAPARCTDGCPHEDTCPYSAIDIYVRRKRHLGVFDLPDRKDEAAIMEKIRTTMFGRCVYKCDNDQPDHYVTTMLFEGGVTASFTMDAFTPWGGRRTRIMGTLGYIDGDGKKFTLYTFRDNKKRVWHKNVAEMAEYKHAGHGGGDHALARDFVEAVASQDPAKLSS
ncbi:MAG: Gfo/Idh/MocA family oxidoreductase, partial [Alistipes sp.]|nr:Gfo/Idh/MocA family oxidoreductase [Alistipes sp.]